MSSTYLEASREIPIVEETEVIVCGGGPAGVTAALAVKNNKLPHDVPWSVVKPVLEKMNQTEGALSQEADLVKA